MIYSQNARIVCLVDFEQDFYKSLQVENLCFSYSQQRFITLFTEVTSQQCSRQKLFGSVVVNIQKSNLRQFFLQWTTPGKCTYKKFKENNLAKVNFLKLLTKENLFECFHYLTTYQKRRRIWAHPNFVEKSTSKQSGFFDHQNYVEKSKQKHRGYFDQINYIVKSTWKHREFFDQRNYIKKVRGNNLGQNYIEKSTWQQPGFFDHQNYIEKSMWERR